MYQAPRRSFGHENSDRAAANGLIAADVLCVARKSRIFDQDEPQNAIVAVESGVVRLSKLLQDGRRQVVRFAAAGGFLEHSLEERHSLSAEALTDARICRIPVEMFDAKSHEPEFLLRLYGSLARELATTHEHVVVLGRANPEEKVCWFVLHMLRLTGRAGECVVSLPMTRGDIADYLGLTLETVCRVMTRLARAGLWTLDAQKIEIRNLAAVKKIVSAVCRQAA